jgi:predicted nucleic acid-binding protein
MPPAFSNTEVIISDTSCLIGLSNINRLEILHDLFGTVFITPEVKQEYNGTLPEWIVVRPVKDQDRIKFFNNFLHLGESSALALAEETNNPRLILDDFAAREYATQLKLAIIGTLGLLIRAYKANILPDLTTAVKELRSVNFRLPADTEALIQEIIKVK